MRAFGCFDVRVYAALMLLALAGVRPSAAQQEVRGTVLDGTSGAPVPGAMVVLLDDDDRALARALSTAAGAFRVLVPSPAHYRLRVDRIGYASTLTAPFEVAEGDVFDLDVTTTIRPVELPAVEAQGGRRCEVRPAEGLATQRVWEEARKALAAAEWTAERELYRFSGMRYERDVAANGRRVLSERRTPMSRYTDQPFRAVKAADLARHGFVRAGDDEVVFFAPDAAVLLSDAFLDTHCFALTRRGSEERVARPGGVWEWHAPRSPDDVAAMIGLRFEPVPGRELTEVAGVLWLDQDARLRSLEYRYVNLTARLGSDAAGGQIMFRGLPNGTWIVEEWRIRMPSMEAVRNERGDTIRYRVHRFRDEGGVVTRVATARGEVIMAGVPGRVLEGTVRDSLGRPAAGARVRVVGTAFDAVTGADGAFRFPDLGQGRWTIEASHPMLSAVGHAATSTEVDWGEADLHPVRLGLPSVRDVVLGRCRAAPPAARETPLVGRVLDASGAAAAGADVRVLWSRRITRAGGRIMDRNEGVGLQTEGDGTFVVCDVPADDTVRLSASRGGLVSDTVETLTDTSIVVVPELRLVDLDAGSASATLGGRVVCAASGVPLAGVKVTIDPGAIELVTDEDGHFKAQLRPARYHIRMNAPEWGTWSTEVRLRAGSTAHVGAEIDGRCGR